MSTQHPVVVGIDGSPTSQAAVRVAAREAREVGAPLHVVHGWLVTDPGLRLDAPVRLDPATEQQLAKALHAQVREVLGSEADEAVEERVVYGYAGRVLADASSGAHVVVVGSRGLGALRSALLGSVSQYVLEHAECPVMVVHAEPTALGRVVVGVDGSVSSLEALRWADERARHAGVPLVAVHAAAPAYSPLYPVPALLGEGWECPEVAHGRLDGWLREALGATRAAEVTLVVDTAPAARLLLEQLAPDDLAVVGRRGTGGVLGLRLGSVARRVASQAPGTVVVLGGAAEREG